VVRALRKATHFLNQVGGFRLLLSKQTIMSESKLLPIFDPKKFILEGGEIMTPLYRQGDPRNYRLGMGKGVLTLDGKVQVTKPSKEFKVLPIAFRCLQDGLFGNEIKKWCEVYFINGAGHLCVFMFHGFSVQNLSRATSDLFYSEAGLTEVIWNVSFKEKTNKAAKSKYYIAEFEFEAVEVEDLPTITALKKNIQEKYFHIYRSDTAEAKTLFSENWSNGSEPTKAEIQEEKDLEAQKLKEFEPKEKGKPAASKAA